MNTTDSRLKKLLQDKDKERQAGAKKKKKISGTDVDISKVDEMSESELVEYARLVGFEEASRQLPREELIDLILGTRETVPEDPVQAIRERTFRYVQANKSLMASQMPCDLHCPTCPQRIVVACYADNSDLVDSTFEES